MRAHRETVS